MLKRIIKYSRFIGIRLRRERSIRQKSIVEKIYNQVKGRKINALMSASRTKAVVHSSTTDHSNNEECLTFNDYTPTNIDLPNPSSPFINFPKNLYSRSIYIVI